MRALVQFLRMLGRASTYHPRRNYFMLFGFLVGAPAPIACAWIHLYALEWQYSLWGLLVRHPFHWAFIAFPFALALLFGGLGAARINRDTRLSALVRRLAALSTTDELTGLSNTRHFHEQLGREVDRSQRGQGAFSLVLFDLDTFKRINDARGHQNGDMALREVACLIRSTRRRYDTVARCGGDEFALILAGAGRAQAMRAAERFRATLANHGFLGTHSQGPCSVTGSFGVATYPDDGTDGSLLFAAADEALYKAKARGGNAVCATSQPVPPDQEAGEDVEATENQPLEAHVAAPPMAGGGRRAGDRESQTF